MDILRKLSPSPADPENRTIENPRISYWNSFYTEQPYSENLTPRELLLTILKKYLLHITSEIQFCFEAALLFIDIPKTFTRFIRHFPVSTQTSLKIAYRILAESIEKQPNEEYLFINTMKFAEEVIPEEDFQKLLGAVRDYSNRTISAGSLFSYASEVLKSHRSILANLLVVFPPNKRIHYCFKMSITPPPLTVTLDTMEVTYEMIQASSPRTR